MKKIVPYSFCN